MKITGKIFNDLAIGMICFGVAIGALFPFFVMTIGVPGHITLTPEFYMACMGAGVMAGLLNFLMARWIVRERILRLCAGMRKVEAKLRAFDLDGNMSACTPETCCIVVDSEDEIGESARAFNQLVEALAASKETEEAFRSFSKMLTGNLELAGLSEKALNLFLEHCGAQGGAVLYDADGVLKVAASLGIDEPESLITNGQVQKVVRTGEIEIIEMPKEIHLDGVLASFTPCQVTILPLHCKSIPLGVVILGASAPFTQVQRSRMVLFAHGLGLAMNNALVHDRLKRLSALDPLTGVYNRRFGSSRLHEEFSRAVRISGPLGVMMMDIDHFKSVNDTYGHMIGDRVLKVVTECIRKALREGDLLIRYGGEEFLAVFPGAATEDIRALGERIRRITEETSISAGDQTLHVTISLGGVSFPEHHVENPDALIQLADEALYTAKETGRNRLQIASHTPANHP